MKANDDPINKQRANSLPREEEGKVKTVTAKPPICRRPSSGGPLNQTEEIKSKLPPKAPLANKTASAATLKSLVEKDEIIGTGNIDNYIVGGQIGQGAML